MRTFFRLTGTALIILVSMPAGTIPVHSAVATPTIILNELMWMGSSLSSSDEWIELYNPSSATVDLAGWTLTKWASGVDTDMLTIPAGTIPASGYFVIANYPADHANSRLAEEPDLVDNTLSLSNSALRIALFDAEGAFVDIAGDGSAPIGGAYISGQSWASMERKAGASGGELASSWYASTVSVGWKAPDLELGTPGAPNSNISPTAEAGEDVSGTVGDELTFDGSGSVDEDGDDLTYAWDFGDGQMGTGDVVHYAFAAAGDYTVTLTVSDGRSESEDTLLATIEYEPTVVSKPHEAVPILPGDDSPEHESTSPIVLPDDQEEEVDEYETSDAILISELLPNPDGDDATGEYIELLNTGDADVSLDGWTLRDPKSSYTISGPIVAGGMRTLWRTETGMTLNNGGDMIFLDDPFGKPINGVEYASAPSGKSFSRDGATDHWEWTEPSPDEPTILAVFTAEDDTNDPDSESVMTISEARDQELRTRVVVAGTVIAEPGLFGAQVMYIMDGDAGLQISSSKGLFPGVSIGDDVEITGSMSEAHGETKLNIAAADDVRVTGHGIEPVPFSISAPDEDTEGMLVKVTGTLTEKRGRTLVLDMDGMPTSVSLKQNTGISTTTYRVDNQLAVTGIVTEESGEYRLLPRGVDDIQQIVVPVDQQPTGDTVSSGGIASAAENNDPVVGPPSSEESSSPWMLIGIALAGIAALGYRYRDRLRSLFSKKKIPSDDGIIDGEDTLPRSTQRSTK